MRTDTHANRSYLILVTVLGLIMLMGATVARAQQESADEARTVRVAVAEDDSLQVRFTRTFDAGDLDDGYVPEAVIAANKVISGAVVFKEGDPVTVEVIADEVEDNGRAGKPGRLQVVFKSVTASNGKEFPVNGRIERKGNGRGILAKIFTLFLIKGEDPRVESTEVFHPKFPEMTFIHVERP